MTERVKVEVKLHAKQRAEERFPGYKLARIGDEVREALKCGRLSTERPDCLAPPRDPAHAYTVYAWTEGFEKIFAMQATEQCWVVMTVMTPRDHNLGGRNDSE